ncbi:tyrosine-type recombinase/integrase [Senegalia massiliensis]|nr:tyrosine-type recombinase/integrase [Senegalia massiliensis]
MIKGTLTLVEPKTKKSNRSVAVHENVMEVLKAERKKQIGYRMVLGETYKNNNFVCSRDDGRPMNPDYISKTFPKIKRKLGLEVRFHDLKHTHATMLLKQNVHPKVVQERLGDSSIGITMDTYSYVSPDMQKEAAKKIGNIIK